MTPAARVLIVDDNDDTLELVSQLVASAGYEPLIARNGIEAVRLIKGNPPDLIVLDMEMPEMNGFQVINWMDQNDQLNIPIVVYTAYERFDHPDIQLKGVVRVVNKGNIDIVEFIHILQTIISGGAFWQPLFRA